MNCYNCSLESIETAAVGTCHHCSAGVCARHVVAERVAVTTHMLINRVVELNLKAQRLLCRTCSDALRQPRAVK